MLAKKLIEALIVHADQIAAKTAESLTRHPYTKYYHTIEVKEIERRLKGIFKHFERWQQDHAVENLQETYLKFGKVRYHEGVPLPDLLYALILVKSHLMEFLKKTVFTDSPVQLYQEMQFYDSTERFFEEMIYFAVKGYIESGEEEHNERKTSSYA